jgi:tetratricopeptide (TPR) repeat protein
LQWIYVITWQNQKISTHPNLSIMKNHPFRFNHLILGSTLLRMLCVSFLLAPQLLSAQNAPSDHEQILNTHKTYYAASKLALHKAFETEKQRLREEIGNSSSTQAQFDFYSKKLQERYDFQTERLFQVSSLFYWVNEEKIDSLSRQALALFKAGEVERCTLLLENAKLLERVQQASQQQWDQIDIEKEERHQQDLAALRLLADIYQLILATDKAEILFDQLLRLDSNLSLQRAAAAFYHGNNCKVKALNLLPNIVANPELEKEEKARLYEQMGDSYTSLGQLEPALEAYLAHQKANSEILEAFPDRFLVKEQLAVAQEKIGMTYFAMGNLESALTSFEERLRLGQALLKTNPRENRYKQGVMVAYAKLGETYAAMDQLPKALDYFKRSNKMAKELAHSAPKSVKACSDFAVSCIDMGNTHTALGDLEKALTFFKETDRLVQRIFKLEPQSQLFSKYRNAYGSRALALFNLSSKQEDPKLKEMLLGQSLADYQRALKDRYDNAEVLSNMGMIYFMQGQLDSAEIVYRKSVEFAPVFVDARRNLGVVKAIQKDFPAAIEQWKAALEYADEKQSAILYFYIGSGYIDLGEPEKSTQWLEKAYKINPALRK